MAIRDRSQAANAPRIATSYTVDKSFQRRKRIREGSPLEDRRNAFILLLVVLLFVFVAVNIGLSQTIESTEDADLFHGILNSQDLRGRRTWISSKSVPFNQDQVASRAQHLILVAGHSVSISGHLEDADVDEKDWYLLDYQHGQGLPQAIHAHIQAGIDEAKKDPLGLLIFSGGETRAITGPLTEGSSYFHVADAMKMWPPGSNIRARTITEEFATDSFQNLLFSICRFREVTGNYPSKITTVSFTFKRRRFETLHAAALRWPADNFFYIGIDPPLYTGFDLSRASEGELENAAKPFETDPYGCNTDLLQQKRKERNPFFRTPPYQISCPEMKPLLNWCSPDYFPTMQLPWDKERN